MRNCIEILSTGFGADPRLVTLLGNKGTRVKIDGPVG